MEFMLHISKLTKQFGGLVAVHDVSFLVDKGEIVGIIGPNGAGKTTLINMVSGIFQPTTGQIFFNGEDITGLTSYRIAQKGIGRTFQLTSLFSKMVVLENVMVAVCLKIKMPWWMSTFRPLLSTKQVVQRAEEIIDFVGLSPWKYELSTNLPFGCQRRLELSIALALNPEVLLLDEPLSGMTGNESQEMIGLLKSLKENGMTLLIIEHNVRALINLCDRMIAMNYGKKIVEGTADEVIKNGAVVESYLGALRFDR
jgi:branched-chain amino acid transport system ATP-binding protein